LGGRALRLRWSRCIALRLGGDATMTDSAALQLILGPDKRNPCFCLYVDVAEKEIHVYYGLEVLEVVPNDPRSPAYRLLGARLYNAGLRVRTLEAVFGLDRKTLRKWGLALRSGDRKWLAEVLAGRSGRRKLTLEMESYVRFRWLALRAEGRRDSYGNIEVTERSGPHIAKHSFLLVLFKI